MKLFSSLKQFTFVVTRWFTTRPLPVKIVFIALIAILGWFALSIFNGTKSQKPQYQTSQAETGTLVTSISASGNVTTGGAVTVSTQATGIVNSVYVKNGDTVTQGQKIADITLDQTGAQKQAAAWASYLSTQNQLNSAQTSLYTLQSTMYAKWKTYKDIAENSTYQNADGSPNTENRTLTPFTIAQDDWLAAEATYKNQQNVIAQAQASLTSAWYSYQQASATILAPAAGIIDTITIAPGLPLSGQSSSDTATNQNVAVITPPEGNVLVTVDLSEIDAPKVQPGQKATLTLDAFPNKTFTGNVLIVNTNGSVNSGVTIYPATIIFENAPDTVYPNMAVDAKIITSVKDAVILVPSGAVSTANGEPTVRVLKNGEPTAVPVEIGDSNDTQTQILSGIQEGDVVITGSTNGSTQSGATSSPFSAFGQRGLGGGSSTIRINR